MISLALMVALGGTALDSSLVVRNVRVLDVRTGSAELTTLLIERGVITKRAVDVRAPALAHVIDANGLTAIPGLIDTHVHLALGGRPRDNAETTLRAGYTTIADLGSPRGLGVRIHRLVDADSSPGPAIIPAGSWIGGRGGVCEFGGGTVRGMVEAQARTRADILAGAALIKVCLSDWLVTAVTAPDSIELTADELKTIVQTARESGIQVAAHAIGERSVTEALKAGIQFFAHTPVVGAAVAAEMGAKRVCVSTTLATLQAQGGSSELRRSFALMRDSGVRMAFGTDAGVLPHGRNSDEFKLLAEFGMTPLEALQSATIVAAECLGLNNYGRIEEGAPATFILVDGDVRDSVGVTVTPIVVIRNGRVYEGSGARKSN